MKKCRLPIGLLAFVLTLFVSGLGSAFAADGPASAVSLVDQPDWAIAYGDEYWNAPADGGDISGVVERVTSAFQRADDGTFEVDSPTHRTSLTDSGIVFEPKLPGDSGALPTRADIHTAAVQCGGSPVDVEETDRWSVTGNTAQRRLASHLGLIEHILVQGDTTELTWEVGSNGLKTCSGLTVRARVDGLSHTATTVSGHHFADASGQTRLQVSHATIVDGSGSR